MRWLGTPTTCRSSVAAGNPVTAEVGAEILRAGGIGGRRGRGDGAGVLRRRDCVHRARRRRLRDVLRRRHRRDHAASTSSSRCRVSAAGGRSPPLEIAIDFGGQLVPYAVGAVDRRGAGRAGRGRGTARRWGRLPWHDVVRPAIEPRRARRRLRTACTPRCSRTVAPAMLIGEGAAVYGDRDGALLPGRRSGCSTRASTTRCACWRDEGPPRSTPGRSPRRWSRRSATRATSGTRDLAAYEVARVDAAVGRVRGRAACWRAATTSTTCSGALTALEVVGPTTPRRRAADWSTCCAHHPHRGDTTSIAVADADGNACAVTTSLGLSSGVWLADLGIHLNSMMGEGELVRGDRDARAADGLDDVAAHRRRRRRRRSWSRARPAEAGSGPRCCRCSSTCCTAGCRRSTRSQAPRLNPVPDKVHVEPGMSRDGARAPRGRGQVVALASARLVLRRRRRDRRRRARRRSASRRGRPGFSATSLRVCAMSNTRRPRNPQLGKEPAPRGDRRSSCLSSSSCASARVVAIAVLLKGGDDDNAAAGDRHTDAQPVDRSVDCVRPPAPVDTGLDCSAAPPTPADAAAVRQAAAKTLRRRTPPGRRRSRPTAATSSCELDGKAAPQTVSSFIFLAQKDYFDDTPATG